VRVGRSAGVTDPGRKRRQNEDSFVCRPPLFAIADGVGGAQAGEIASRLAAGALMESEEDGRGGEERVASLIKEANRRIYRRSSEDASVLGMGTTMTVALAGTEAVAVGHVGDSRAYLIRDGQLEQLTDDHSLVAELVRSGKLSPEEAERHPQRSVITRALGSDPDVDVDTFSVEAHEGDLFMLCSDGLTDMVEDEQILRTFEKHRGDLRSAAKALVATANKQGGEDNITVVCFDVTEVDETSPLPALEPDEGPAPEADDEDTLSGLEPVAETRTDITPQQLDEWLAIADPADREEPPPPRRRRWPARHPVVIVVAALVVLAAVFGVALWGLSSAYFVGARPDGRLAVYQGLPFDVSKGVHLYREVYVSPAFAAQLSEQERRSLLGHDLRSRKAARNALRSFEASANP
jgi:serine/threonine protein phosphatase PrpC